MDTINKIVHESKAADLELKMDKVIVCAALKLNVDDWCLQFVCDWCDKQLNTFASILKHYLLEHMCVSDEKAQEAYTKHVGDFNANDTDTTDACDSPDNAFILKEEEVDIDIFCNDDIEFPEAETILPEDATTVDNLEFSKPFKCSLCDRSYNYKKGLNDHRRLKHRVTVTVVNDAQARNEQNKAANQQTKPVRRKRLRFNCEKCGKSCFQTPTQTNICRKCNVTIRPYACHLCDAKFREKPNLNLHVKRHIGIKPFLCPICGKGFVSSNDHKRHIKETHNKERPFSCDECGKRYPTKGRLNLHLRRHRNERNYECPKCGKCFYETGSLNTHMQIHSKDKPFACHVCELKFPVKSYLNEHLKVHSNFKAYKCEVCAEAFVQIAGLCSHRKRHHPDFNRENANTN